MAYICAHCGRKQKGLEQFVRCSFCGSRVLLKGRPNLAREVDTN